jgi:hypothetical protein
MTDICGNKLIIERGVYLTVSYITGDKQPRELMAQQLKEKDELVNKADNYEVERLSRMI